MQTHTHSHAHAHTWVWGEKLGSNLEEKKHSLSNCLEKGICFRGVTYVDHINETTKSKRFLSFSLALNDLAVEPNQQSLLPVFTTAPCPTVPSFPSF